MDHAALVDRLGGLEGDWICSYEDLSEGFEVYVVHRDEKRFINSGKRRVVKDVAEWLVMNFKPVVE